MVTTRISGSAEGTADLTGPQARFLAWAARRGFAVLPTRRLEPGEACPPGFRVFPDSLRERGEPTLCQPANELRWVQSRPLGGRFRPQDPSWARLLRFLEEKLQDVVMLELDAATGAIARLIRPRRTFDQHCAMLAWMVEDRVISALDALGRITPAQIDRSVAPRVSARRRRQAPLLRRGRIIHRGLAVGALGRELLLLDRPTLKDLPRLRQCQGAIVAHPGRAAFWLQFYQIPSLEVETLEGLTEGALATLEGDRLLGGALPAWIAQGLPPGLERLLEWADDVSEVRVMANVDSAEEAELALGMGANGIGLCRLERLMGLDLVRDAILRRRSLDELYGALLERLRELFRVVRNMPIVVRLMDQPLHQILPQSPEINPMLGMRGARLAQVAPDLYRTQVRALAAVASERKTRITVLVPGVSDGSELALVEGWLREDGVPRMRLGVMLETPRACLTAGDLARKAGVLSVGSNDLSALVYGISRDDAPVELLPVYLERGLYARDPFLHLDPDGVGKLVELAFDLVKKSRPRATFGLCGEQAPQPATATLADRLGFDFLSATPLRVPGLRLALAQSWIARTLKK